MSQAEIDAALDAIEGEQPEIVEEVEEITDEVIEEESEEEITEEAPKGYMTYEEWIEAGKDPDLFKGKKAYSAEYERIQDSKQMQRDLKDMKQTLKATAESIDSVVESRVEQERTALQQQLAEAKDNDDVDAAIDASNKLNALESKPKQEAPQQVNPLISDFFNENPMLDESSNQFDPNMSSQMQRIYNNTLRQLDDGSGQFTEHDIKSALKSSFNQVKQLNPDRFESPRNTRQTAKTPPKRKASKVNASDNLKSMKVDRRNPRDNNALNDVYELLKKKDPKAAEQFAKNMTGAK